MDFSALFEPRTIAVVGMSTSKVTAANRFVENLRSFGYRGEIFAIHPHADEIDGVPAFPSFSSLPAPVDYAYVAVAAPHLPALLTGANGRVKFAQVISSGFAELPGRNGQLLQQETLRTARAEGIRIIGPNCLGTYSPKGRVTFVDGAPREAGSIGVISQSGGLAVDFVRRGGRKGLRFSGLVTVGNAADVDSTELLEHYLDDPDTNVIGLYLENSRFGRRLFELLSRACGTKSVVLLKGGRSEQGNRAATSHTGALASNDRMWVALAKQTGAILVETLDQFIDVLSVLQSASIHPGVVTRDVVLVGNGGGTSVLASDAFWHEGLGVPPLSKTTIQKLEALGLPPGTSVINPVDTPAGAVAVRDGRVMQDIMTLAAQDPTTDALIVHLNLAVLVAMNNDPETLLGNVSEAAWQTHQSVPAGKRFLMVLRSDGDPVVEEHRRRLQQALSSKRIPVFDELIDAAQALGAVQQGEVVVARRSSRRRYVSSGSGKGSAAALR